MSPLSMSQRAEPGPIYKVSWPEGSRLLQPILHECNDNAKIDDTVDISCLLWADDILTFSKSEEGLQKKLDKLDKYCTDNKLTVNTSLDPSGQLTL